MEQFEAFTNDILQTYDLPDEPSYKHAIGATVMHLGPLVTYKPKSYFGKAVTKAMANHAAFEGMQKFKKEEAAFEAKIRASNSNGVKDVQGPSSEVVS